MNVTRPGGPLPVNICFHGVGTARRELEPGEDSYWISKGFFADILDTVKDRTDVRLSFDDGNVNDVEIALPALRERGLTATFFPLAARLDAAGSLSRSDIAGLVEAGMPIGSHGMWHRPWRGMTALQLQEELVVARRMISEAAGQEIVEAACPLGRYDRRVLTRLRRLGYTRVFTSDRSRSHAASWLQARYSVRNTDDLASVRTVLDDPPQLTRRAVATARTVVKALR